MAGKSIASQSLYRQNVKEQFQCLIQSRTDLLHTQRVLNRRSLDQIRHQCRELWILPLHV
jgi:hypothetical protein